MGWDVQDESRVRSGRGQDVSQGEGGRRDSYHKGPQSPRVVSEAVISFTLTGAEAKPQGQRGEAASVLTHGVGGRGQAAGVMEHREWQKGRRGGKPLTILSVEGRENKPDSGNEMQSLPPGDHFSSQS